MVWRTRRLGWRRLARQLGLGTWLGLGPQLGLGVLGMGLGLALLELLLGTFLGMGLVSLLLRPVLVCPVLVGSLAYVQP